MGLQIPCVVLTKLTLTKWAGGFRKTHTKNGGLEDGTPTPETSYEKAERALSTQPIAKQKHQTNIQCFIVKGRPSPPLIPYTEMLVHKNRRPLQ